MLLKWLEKNDIYYQRIYSIIITLKQPSRFFNIPENYIPPLHTRSSLKHQSEGTRCRQFIQLSGSF